MGAFAQALQSLGGLGNDLGTAQQNVKALSQQDKVNDFTNQLNALKLRQLQMALGQPSKDDPSAQFAAIEKALGRPLTNTEKATWLQIAPKTPAADKFVNVPEGDTVLDTSTGKPVFTNPAKPPKDPNSVDPSIYDANIKAAVAGHVNPPPGDTKYGAEWWAEAAKLGLSDKLKTRSFAAGAEGGDNAVTLTPQAVDAMTDIFIRTGQLPALGLGATNIREKIFNRAGEILNGKGSTSGAGDQVAANRSAYTALSSSLTQLQRQQAAVNAFESVALKNLDLFTQKAQPIVDSGSPWVNTPLRAVNQQGLGSADLAAYNAARVVALTEVSRVLSNPNLTGVLSDEARNQVSSLVSPNATLAQINSAVNVLKQDMANRKQAIADEIANLRGQLSGPGTIGAGGGGSTGNAPPQGSKVIPLDEFLREQ